MLAASKSKFLPSVFETDQQAPSSPNRPRPGQAKAAVPTLGSVFKKDLQSLLNAIEEADPHFVRCMAQILKSTPYYMVYVLGSDVEAFFFPTFFS